MFVESPKLLYTERLRVGPNQALGRWLGAGRYRSFGRNLVVTSENRHIKKYVTLSHCWGKAEVLKLTKDTVSALKHGIPVEELPLTFQHTVEVTRRLQARYIWIDSLCIFQDKDDKSDWLREGHVMHKIYSHSFLNIAATGAIDGTRGLFSTRDPDYELKQTIATVAIPSDDDSCPRTGKAYEVNEILFLGRQLMSAPLNKRAWVLQERLLAPRVLHFGSSQLFWECRNGVLCERFPERLPTFIQKQGLAAFKSLTHAFGKPLELDPLDESSKSSLQQITAYKLWNQYVAAYSNSLLTYQSDKLVALSGIAKFMQNRYNDDYVAGMWRRYLAHQLLWEVDSASQSNGEPSTRDFPYRAPTWSWMSVDGIIRCGSLHCTEGLWIEVESVEMK
jgi:hypothetical protein